MSKRAKAVAPPEQPLCLLPPRFVTLSQDDERRAIDALAGLLLTLIERVGALDGSNQSLGPSDRHDRL